MSYIRVDLPNTKNKWVGFGLANIDMFIIRVRFGLTNIDPIRILTRYDTNTTYRHELPPLLPTHFFQKQKQMNIHPNPIIDSE